MDTGVGSSSGLGMSGPVCLFFHQSSFHACYLKHVTAASVSDILWMFGIERRQPGKKAKAPNQLLRLLLTEKKMLFQDCLLSRFCLCLLAVPGPHEAGKSSHNPFPGISTLPIQIKFDYAIKREGIY